MTDANGRTGSGADEWTPARVREAGAALAALQSVEAALAGLDGAGEKARVEVEVWGGVGVPRCRLDAGVARRALAAEAEAWRERARGLGVTLP